MNFSVDGPFKFDLLSFCKAKDEGHLPSWKKEFWKTISDHEAGLPSAIGLYTLCLVHGNNVKPWYVGKTSARGGFKVEVFQNHKADHYASLRKSRGSAQISFFALRTDTGRLSSNYSANKTIEWVEKRLITYALDRNPDLLNSRDTAFLKSVYLPGLIGRQKQGPPSSDAVAARSIFWGNNR